MSILSARFAGLALALLLAACRPPAAASPIINATSAAFLAGDPGRPPPRLVESTSAVVPANPANAHCPGGRVVLAASDYARQKSSILYMSRDLACLDQPGCFRMAEHGLAGGVDKRGTFIIQNAPEPAPDGRCLHQQAPGGASERPIYPSQFAGTDQIILRLESPKVGPEGRLVHLWQGAAQFPPLVPNIGASDWRGDVPPAPGCNVPLIRYGLFVRVSDDCGDSWSEPTFINFAELPRADGSPYGMERIERGVYVPRGPGVSYGTDRPEMYFDWHDPQEPLYTTASLALASGHYDALLRSMDGGVTWATAYNYPDSGGGPKVMTSTSGGRLYVARCLGGRDERGQAQVYPELSWFDRGGMRLLGRVRAAYKRDGVQQPCRRADPRLMAGEPDGPGDLSISHGVGAKGVDEIRVVYGSAPPGGMQSLYVVNVDVQRETECRGGAACAKVENGSQYDPPPGFSTFHAHVVDAERAGNADELVSLLHFQLWGAPGRPSTPSFFFLRERGKLEGPAPLSEAWAPNLGSRRFAGDYNYGTFFVSTSDRGETLFNFLVQWPESQRTEAEPNLYLRHRILSVRLKH